MSDEAAARRDDLATPERAALGIRVNGTDRRADGVGSHTTTLDWLRSIGNTGAKEGCAEGECGACAVLVSRSDGAGGTRWTAINSCLVPVAALGSQEIVTAEGLGRVGDLHPVQREMAHRGGSQCGYCTPGFVCAMAAEFYREDRAATSTSAATSTGKRDGAASGHDHETGPNGFDLHALSGNLCRCTGYRPIQDAAYALEDPGADDALAQRRSQPAPTSPPLTLTGQDGTFVRPDGMGQTLRLLAENPEAVLLAGSTDWGVEANLRHRRAPLVMAVDSLPELRRFDLGAETIEIGAALSLSEVERLLAHEVPLMDQLFPQFASRLIRNSATLGGNLGTGSPIGDAPPVLLALDASVVLASTGGEREVRLADYFTGYRESVRRPDELITAIRLPRQLLPQSMFSKIAKRRFDDISSVAVAIAARIEGGVIEQVRIGLGGVAAMPLRASATEEVLTGQEWTPELAEQAAEVMAAEGTPMDDHRASAAYRIAMLRQALLRFHAQSAHADDPKGVQA